MCRLDNMSVINLSLLSRLRLDSLIRHHTWGTRQFIFSACPFQQTLLRQGPVLYKNALTYEERPLCPSKKLHHDSTQFFYTALSRSSRDIPALKPSEIADAEYENCAEETLDSLTEFFEDLPENESCNDDYDCAYGTGVLTVHLGSTEGTYVINKQSPNKQIWLSSPLSGPKRFDYFDGQWVYLRDGKGLHHVLEEELTEIMGFKIELKKCKYYSGGIPEAK